MTKTLRRCCVAAFAAVALVPAQADAAIRVGVGDQSIRMFDDATFKELDLRQVRYFVRWDVMHHESDRRRLRAWVRKAIAEDKRPLVHLSTNSFVEKEADLPSVSHYRKDVSRLVRYLRRYGVRDFGTWNEANHKTQPTWDEPRRAAQYFKQMYRAVHRGCTTRSCRVVALDVLDQPGKERYIESFYDGLRSRTWQRRARFVGIHNYSDVNRGSRTRTRAILKAVRRHNRSARFWFTETGGLVGFGKNFPCDPNDPQSVERAEERAARAVRRVFSIARSYRSVGVQRIFLYNWYGNNCAPNGRTDTAGRASDEMAGFDAGLVREDGTRRPALGSVERALEGSFKR